MYNVLNELRWDIKRGYDDYVRRWTEIMENGGGIEEKLDIANYTAKVKVIGGILKQSRIPLTMARVNSEIINEERTVSPRTLEAVSGFVSDLWIRIRDDKQTDEDETFIRLAKSEGFWEYITPDSIKLLDWIMQTGAPRFFQILRLAYGGEQMNRWFSPKEESAETWAD